MRLFEQTLRGLPTYLNQFDSRSLSKAVNVSESIRNFSITKKSSLIIDFNEDDLSRYFSPSPLRFQTITIGDHPDFKRLGHEETMNHYAVSLFMDIKGSTGLIEIVRDLEELRRLKDTILTLAIKVCNYFGGHVQRLQGDGIFVLFTRREFEPSDAIIGALNASAVLTYFVKYELAPEIQKWVLKNRLELEQGLIMVRLKMFCGHDMEYQVAMNSQQQACILIWQQNYNKEFILTESS